MASNNTQKEVKIETQQQQPQPQQPIIPIIDISPFIENNNNETEKKRCAQELFEASHKIGFFLIQNYQLVIPQPLVDEVFSLSKAFFDLPPEEKEGLRGKDYFGYCALGEENGHRYPQPDDELYKPELGGYKEAFGVPREGSTLWPKSLGETWKLKMVEYCNGMAKLSSAMMRIFAMALNLTMEPTQYLPKMYVQGVKAIGMVFMTLKDIAPTPESFIVNVGDALQRWTNDFFKSAVHRAINTSGKHRYSIPFFVDPGFDTTIECLRSCIGDGVKYPPIKYSDHFGKMYEKGITEHQKKINPE